MNKYDIILRILLIIGISVNIQADTNNITCYNCDTKDESCTTLESEITIASCDANICYTILDGTLNKRGCLSSLSDFDKKLCATNNINCQTCNISNCNNVILPETRSKCYKCSDDNCTKDILIFKPSYCKNITRSGCFTYFDGTITIRDCIDDHNSNYDLCKTNKNYCNECSSNTSNKIEACNNQLPELKCYECGSTSGDCKKPPNYSNENECSIEEVPTKKCLPVDEFKNLCYTHININNKVTRGCLSEFDDFKNPGKLLNCSGDKCNHECVNDISCIQCDSNNDRNCSSTIESEIKQEWTKKCNEYTNVCHRCERQDGTTFRGCGPPKEQNCNYCFNNSCIAEPPKRKCYKCNENDLNCSWGIDTKLKEIVCDNTMSCFTGLTKTGFIQRDCLPIGVDLNKEYLESKICNDSNLCNTHILPVNRLLCYQCNENIDNWCKDPNSNEKYIKGMPCHKYIENDQCYMYSNENKTMIRGCLSDDINTNENRKGCDSNSKNKNCIKCNTKHCNLTPFLRHSIKCIKCKDIDEKCSLGFEKHDAKDCHETPYYTNETCFTHINDSKINRGCTLDNENKQFNCIDSKNDMCKICKEDSCNIEKIEHQKCIQCRSDAIPVCSENGVGNMEPVLCKDENHSNNLGCYTELYKNIVMRSCVSDLTPDEIEECKKNKDCIICHGNGCNNKKPPNSAIGILKCVQCSHDNNKCVQSPENIVATECMPSVTECFTAMSPSGSTVRGCYSENHHNCQGDYNCTICHENNCNNKIIPENRIRCYQCSDIDCIKVNEKDLLPCHSYNENDECYTYSGANEFKRGCKTDMNYNWYCKDEPKFCSICNESGCNKNDLKPLDCYSCRSNDGKCKKPKQMIDIKTIKCEPDLDGSLCYTHVDQNNFVTRGCARDKVYKKNEGHFLEICQNDKCNNKVIENINCPQCNITVDKECGTKDFKSEWIKDEGCGEFNTVCHSKCVDQNENVFRGCGKSPAHGFKCTFCYENCDKKQNPTPNPTSTPTTSKTPDPNPVTLSCYQCRSDADTNCKRDLDENKKQNCQNQGKDKKIGCYTEVWNGLVMRGCIADLTTSELKECNNNKNCVLCNTNNCNNQNSSAITLTISKILLSTVLIYYGLIIFTK